MRSTVNSKVMIGSKPELNWKDVTKGKRSRKAVPRRYTKSGNISPKRVGDFSGSESDKLAASSVVGQRKSGKSEHVPIKKRRQLIESRASPPSPKPNSSLAGVDDLARAAYGKEFISVTLSKRVKNEGSSWDFSGIELLAATATTMEVCADDPMKVDCDVEDNSVPGSSDASVVSESKLGLKCNESGNSSSTTPICADNTNCSDLNKCGATSLSPCVSSKVDRRFWDLNTDMEAWVEPFADTHVEGLQENSDEFPNPAVVGVESFSLKQEDKLGDAPNRTSSSKTTSLEKCLVKPEKISRSSDGVEIPNRAIKTDVDEDKSYQVVCGDADVETPGQVIRADAIMDGVQTKIQGAEKTGAAVYALKIATAYEKDFQNSYEPQGNMTSPRKTIAFITCKRDDRYNSKPDEVNCLSSVSKSGYFLASGTITKDEKCVDSTVQSDKTCVSGLMIAESHSQLKQEILVAKHEDNHPNEGLGGIKFEDSCNSYSTRPHDDLTASVGKVDNTMDPCPDSPYEDGELRGSFLYWEENDLETELVDYESDGRKEDSTDAADNIGSEVVEGGSEGSHVTEGNGEKKNAVKYPLRRNFTKDDSKNNETSAKKESDGGSGTTVDHSMEMPVDENNDLTRRRYLTNRSGMDDCKAVMGEYVSRMAREKLQSRTDADDKGAFFLPHYRSHHLGGFRDRDVTPEKYVGKYAPASYRGGRDGVNQWNSWGSSGRYTSTYQGNEGFSAARPRRSFTGDSVDKFDGLDFHEQKQPGDYLSRDTHRPVVRTRSPVERDNQFSMGKKLPPARRIDNYRSSAHYPQSGDFEPANAPAAPVRFSRVPGRDRSFSPNSAKEVPFPSNRRRSRSRSRTRSPRVWHSSREASFGHRRHSGSPDFRSEARMERVKVPFHKPKFTPEYREGCVSLPRGCFPSQRNSRWVGDRSFGDNNDRNFGDNHFKRRRSPTGFRFNDQSTNTSGRFKSDEYYRPMNRPRRFPFVENDVRDTKSETMYDYEKLENKGEMHRATQHVNGGYFKRFQHDVNTDFEMRNEFGTRNLNNEEGVRAPVIRDVVQVQGGGEDTKETEI